MTIPTGKSIDRLSESALLVAWLYEFNARAWQEKNIKQLKIISRITSKIAHAALDAC